MKLFVSQCALCLNFNRGDLENETCKAFPGGIPKSLLRNKVSHTKSFKGDHGILFEPIQEPKAKSPVRKSIETLRDELQKLFPEQKVVIR